MDGRNQKARPASEYPSELHKRNTESHQAIPRFKKADTDQELKSPKINMFMKGQDADLNVIYDKFGVDYDLLSLLMRLNKDDEGHFHILWVQQKIA